MAVFPEGMGPLDTSDTKGSLRLIYGQLFYIRERVEHAFTRRNYATTDTVTALEKRIAALELAAAQAVQAVQAEEESVAASTIDTTPEAVETEEGT